MELKDTVAGMVSQDFKERFVAEYRQLEIRTKKLKEMCTDWMNDCLGFTPDCPAELLMDQLEAMEQYLTILKARARIEGIEI